MFALVALETAAIALLGLLVAGLLRSHAEILRQLHHLGVDLDPDRTGGATPGTPTPVGAPRRARTRVPAATVAGHTPDGDAVTVAVDRSGERTLLLFLSSGCGSCTPFWDGLGSVEARRAIPDATIVVVTRGVNEESPGAIAGRDGATVVMSSAAWDDYRVPGSPYAVLVEGGAILGQGVAHSWPQLGSLIDRQSADDRGRRSVDAELLAAGIHPGHPSLYPESLDPESRYPASSYPATSYPES